MSLLYTAQQQSESGKVLSSCSLHSFFLLLFLSLFSCIQSSIFHSSSPILFPISSSFPFSPSHSFFLLLHLSPFPYILPLLPLLLFRLHLLFLPALYSPLILCFRLPLLFVPLLILLLPPLSFPIPPSFLFSHIRSPQCSDQQSCALWVRSTWAEKRWTVLLESAPKNSSPHCTEITVFTQLYPGQKIEKVCMSVLQPIIFTAPQWLNNLKATIYKPTIREVHRPWSHGSAERECRYGRHLLQDWQPVSCWRLLEISMLLSLFVLTVRELNIEKLTNLMSLRNRRQ